MEKVAEPSWTSSYTYQVSKHSAEMLHNLNVQRKDGGRFCDVILRVGEESFPAHKAVLAACSEYFESVFGLQTEDEGDTKELEMHTISPKVFKDILDFAYTSRIVVRLECFPELMTAAKFLLMRSVIEICQEVIKQSKVQILVPSSRRTDASLFRATGATEQAFPVAPQGLINGTGMLMNGQSFGHSTQMHVDVGGESTAVMLRDVLEPIEELPLSPGAEVPGTEDGGPPPLKRSRMGPKKAEEAVHMDQSGLFPCRTCGKAFTEASRLKNHEAQHGASTGGVNNPNGGVSLLENGVQSHAGLDNGRKRERNRGNVGCETCGKAFRDVYHLNRHKLSHSGEKPYACPVCGLRFKRKDRMSYHVRSHDGSVGKPYVCQSCGKGFSRPDHLNGHIKQVHTTERPHKCQICDASFATRDRLRSHLACHEDKIPCKVCGKFLRAAYMTDHLKKHSEGTHNYCLICNKDGQENPEKCPHLELEESDPSFQELNNSNELKSPEKADGAETAMSTLACNGVYPEGAKAKAEPEKKFICGICGQAFRTKSYLNKHQHRVHKATKSQVASGCGLSEMAPSLNSPFSPQQNMSLLESFGFQIVQSAFASSLVDTDAGQSGVDFEEKHS
ncbi:POZ-, AT hook-, and zinc finger-containing protein 1 isoform X2 [Gouania willdenowi]|uniref:POZ/BTB and AT hook containing zinc finger 1 n=1 Tax=Gouania willdenowi TaxID=441366 RepID=A0A8C5HIX1_GOUWI|nr:POZ-, AT hook-, and zinc finger-containing protein 1 isoform X2 [Gouania willdenowi]